MYKRPKSPTKIHKRQMPKGEYTKESAIQRSNKHIQNKQ